MRTAAVLTSMVAVWRREQAPLRSAQVDRIKPALLSAKRPWGPRAHIGLRMGFSHQMEELRGNCYRRPSDGLRRAGDRRLDSGKRKKHATGAVYCRGIPDG